MGYGIAPPSFGGDYSNIGAGWGTSAANPLSLDGTGTTPMAGFGQGNPIASLGWDTAPVNGLPAMGPGNDWLSSLSGFAKGAFGTTEAPGWASGAASAAGGMFKGWLGMQQYGLAKKVLAENQRQFNLNYNAQKQTTNTELEDRQRARVASNPGAYQSVGDYMNQNGVK